MTSLPNSNRSEPIFKVKRAEFEWDRANYEAKRASSEGFLAEYESKRSRLLAMQKELEERERTLNTLTNCEPEFDRHQLQLDERERLLQKKVLLTVEKLGNLVSVA